MEPRSKIALASVAAVSAIVATLVFFINPESAWWMPKCLLYTATGIKCPSCGNTRALHQLLHGRIAEAFALNPFAFVAVPLALLIAYVLLGRPRWASPSTGTRLIIAYITLYAAWFAVRNIAGW